MKRNVTQRRKKYLKLNTMDRTNTWCFLPIIFSVAVIPLIVYLKITPLEGIVEDYWIHDKVYDFYSYYKAMFFIFASLLAMLVTAYQYYKGKIEIKKSYIYIPLIAFSLFIILSTLFAEHVDLALQGYPGRYEGMYVLLAYLLMSVITFNVTQTPYQIKLIISGLFLSGTIIGTIGIFQYFGYDFFQSSIGIWLILPNAYKDLVSSLQFKSGMFTITSTLYNSNYVGSYMAMLVPITFFFTLYFKQRKFMVVTGVISCLMFANLIGSNSRAGMVGITLSFLLAFLLFYKYLLTHWKKVVLIFFAYILIFLLLNLASSGKAINRVESIWNISIPNEETLSLEDVKLSQRSVEFVFNNDLLVFTIEENEELVLKDSKNDLVDYTYNKELDSFVVEDPRFQHYSFFVKDNILVIGIHDALLYFALTNEGMKFINEKGELVTFEDVEHWGFEGRERLGSGRGYIWSRTLPLLKDTLFLGHGPDTFVVYFPQHDYLGKLLYMRNSFELVDKPHNLYLQTAINTGLPSLIAMITMFSMYIISSIRLYWKDPMEHIYAISGIAILIAIVAYLVTGMFNDSVVSVAPVFWILFGLGLACNYLYRQVRET